MRSIETSESPVAADNAAVFNCCFWDLDTQAGQLIVADTKPRPTAAKQLFAADEDAGGTLRGRASLHVAEPCLKIACVPWTELWEDSQQADPGHILGSKLQAHTPCSHDLFIDASVTASPAVQKGECSGLLCWMP